MVPQTTLGTVAMASTILLRRVLLPRMPVLTPTLMPTTKEAVPPSSRAPASGGLTIPSLSALNDYKAPGQLSLHPLRR
ncbi:hypothetical protein CC2G_006717 [Coprinopsis cinerea AmutBmut pab1-1]|nr:hypothetical protein CC2G_006717 [Coprinopsis cinerea AmutBmut pab1-1]